MYQDQLIAAIFFLFLAHAVSGLPFPFGPRHGGHHRFPHHRHPTPDTPPAPKIPITVPTPAIPRTPVTVSPPPTPQAPVTVPPPAIPRVPVTVSPPATPRTPVTLLPPARPRVPVAVSPPATPQAPVTVPPPAIPRVPVAVSPPATPQTPVTVPAQPPPPSLPDGITGEISENEKRFGWDPWKAMKGCGANCDLLKYLRKQEFLIAHNWVRLLFKLPSFTWDEKLESAAKQVVMLHYDDCKMATSDFPYGENIFWGLKSHWTPSDAVYFWYNESEWYNFKNLQCTAPLGEDCAHFTQLVWKDSVRLGCALQHCRDPNKGMLVVCEYDPAGNYDDENPLDDNNAKQHRT